MNKSETDAAQDPVRFDWLVFVERMGKASLAIIFTGAVVITLWHFKIIIDPILPPTVDPLAFSVGAVVLVALTLLGVPVIPAAVAGIAIWLAAQNFI
ncbi:hypothetical protein [Leptolyngbya sp. PCC 6406]|uniref:hypothetical protein n=1 Tax=Leptolyngbya sp. PCC 6406 TaxID=1173264 RepID=UPI0002AC461F|nr:hypothetical protein [Leptolyngbya sp. PCC 6406]